jgi:hypothetical protein
VPAGRLAYVAAAGGPVERLGGRRNLVSLKDDDVGELDLSAGLALDHLYGRHDLPSLSEDPKCAEPASNRASRQLTGGWG